ncbi:MAG: GlxA family transcriptional regulator [Proteobacteria bacterium]|nr:GlxA family transcriptional regulator [Pseudomonadota bacterium]
MPPPDGPRRYAFVLVPGYSQLGFACALEALTLANRHPSGRQFYSWRILSENGAPCPAYNDVTVAVDSGLCDLRRDETLILCAGENAGLGATPRLLAWLRRETKKGMDFGALSAGAWLLARAGLLRGKRVTTHWEYRSALAELVPDVIVEESLFAVDGRVFSCAGGAASMDLMLYRVHAEYGPELANWVADQMVYADPRSQAHAQRRIGSVAHRVRHGRLAMALQIMDNNIEDPMTPDEIADLVGLSTRQLERLFQQNLQTSPKRHYMTMRLEKARDLLRQTTLSITDVATACGFKTVSHFSRSYARAFGLPPSRQGSSSSLVWTPGPR